LKIFKFKKTFALLLCLVVLTASTAQTYFSGNTFEDTLSKWLAYVGFRGEVLEYQKIYDDNRFIDYFRIMLLEDPSEKNTERKQTRIFFEVNDNENYEFANLKLLEKDIKDLPYMYTDFIARFAISYAIKKVSKSLALPAKTEKVREGLYKITIDPAPTSEVSRFRFHQIEIFYEVKNLFLNMDLTVKGQKNYLMLSFLKSEINGILRSLENGNFPGVTSEILISKLLKRSSDQLLRGFLKIEESSHETFLMLQNNPELEVEEWNPVD
jgi:hypothetical protein